MEEEEEEGEPPEQLLMGLVEKSVERKLDEVLRRLSAVECAVARRDGGVATPGMTEW